MNREVAPEQVRGAAEKILKESGYREPYEFVNEVKVLVGEEKGNFVYCLQYKIRRSAKRTPYIIVAVDETEDLVELAGQVVGKSINNEIPPSALYFSFYR